MFLMTIIWAYEYTYFWLIRILWSYLKYKLKLQLLEVKAAEVSVFCIFMESIHLENKLIFFKATQ